MLLTCISTSYDRIAATKVVLGKIASGLVIACDVMVVIVPCLFFCLVRLTACGCFAYVK